MSAMPRDLIVSTSDAKHHRVAGEERYPRPPAADTLDLIDCGVFPPRLVARVEVEASVAGPPQAVAITPDGTLAIVSAPNRLASDGTLAWGRELQVVDLRATPPRVSARVPVSHHPQGLAIDRAGRLLLAATTGGTLAAFAIERGALRPLGETAVSSGRLAGVAIVPDGSAALVALRDEQGVAVVAIDGDRLVPMPQRIAAGVAPYAIDIAADGRLAVVGNVGLAGLAGPRERLGADRDSVTLIDLAVRPGRAVQHLTVPAVPEGVAISPDGRWIAVQAMDGSHLPAAHPARTPRGRLLLFAVRGGRAEPVDDLPGGEAGQGVAFSADGRLLLVQFNVERQVAVFATEAGRLRDTGHRIAAAGGPASIRTMPR